MINIIKIAIQYPYLESSSFCNKWLENKESDDERYLRYENYCILVFNYLERLCKFHRFNKEKIQQDLNVKAWIRVHKTCWLNPSVPFENADSYDPQFKKIVENFIS